MSKTERNLLTLSLERQLLHYLSSNKLLLQRYYSKCRASWFTSDIRIFIFNKILEYFHEHNSILSLDQFAYELKRHFPDEDKKQQLYHVEFEVIINDAPQEDIELIIDKLEETEFSIGLEKIFVKGYESLRSGHSNEAFAIAQRELLNLKIPKDTGRVLSLHHDTDDWVEELENRKYYPEKYAGLKTGFPTFDKKTSGMFSAELIVVFGLSGKGKSTVMKAIGSNVRRSGYNVLHCGNEENEFQMRTKYQAVESGIPYYRLKSGTYTAEELERWKEFNKEQRTSGGSLYLYEFPQGEDATSIERVVIDLKLKGVKIDLIIVDYLDLMRPIKKCYDGENEEHAAITNELKQLSINCDCPVLTCTQAGTQAEKQELKERPFLTASDVFGTKRKVHSANVLWGIVNQTATVGIGEKTEEERKVHKLVMAIPKNRDGGIFTFRCKMFVETGLVVEDNDEDIISEEVARQALEMINDNNESGSIRSNIDLQTVISASNDDMTKKVENILSQINDTDNEPLTANDDVCDNEQTEDSEKLAISTFNKAKTKENNTGINLSSILNKLKNKGKE